MCFCLLPVTGLNSNFLLLRELWTCDFWTFLPDFGLNLTSDKVF